MTKKITVGTNINFPAAAEVGDLCHVPETGRTYIYMPKDLLSDPDPVWKEISLGEEECSVFIVTMRHGSDQVRIGTLNGAQETYHFAKCNEDPISVVNHPTREACDGAILKEMNYWGSFGYTFYGSPVTVKAPPFPRDGNEMADWEEELFRGM